MSHCKGRCTCHAADWEALDQAAGITRYKRGRRGPAWVWTEREACRKALAARYLAEWDKVGRDPNYRPTKTQVAEGQLPAFSERTLRRYLDRFDISWPPEEGDYKPPYRPGRIGLVGRAAGAARTWGILSKKLWGPPRMHYIPGAA